MSGRRDRISPMGTAAITPKEPVTKRTVDPEKRLNDLEAKEWIPETISVWTQKGLGRAHPDTEIEKQHPAPYSFTDVARLVRFFSKPGDTILDPFLGIGSTLKAAALEGRNGVGIELNPKYADLSRIRLEKELVPNLLGETDQLILEGDCRELLPTLARDSVTAVITSPPYWNILHKKDHKAKSERVDKGLDSQYSDSAQDLGNVADYADFLDELVGCFDACMPALKPKGHMCIVVSDFRDQARFIMFHAHLAERLEQIGLVLKGIKILHQKNKRIFPYGYPYAYVPNIHHQYILILQKPSK
jgi:DNA modification methylase